MCFGAPPRGERLADHPIILYGEPITWVDEYRYVGAIFCSTEADIFSCHFEAKARRTTRVAHVTLASELMMGTLRIIIHGSCRFSCLCQLYSSMRRDDVPALSQAFRILGRPSKESVATTLPPLTFNTVERAYRRKRDLDLHVDEP